MLRQARQSTANSYQPPVTYCSTTPILASFNFTMTESIYSLSTPFRVLCAILMVTAVLINIGNLPADGESTSAINGIRSTSVQELASDVPTIQSCTDKLNELDQVFDRRREARAIFSSGKDERWEWYEPESVCISEERFGSMVDERYMAFDDGTFLICLHFIFAIELIGISVFPNLHLSCIILVSNRNSIFNRRLNKPQQTKNMHRSKIYMRSRHSRSESTKK